MKRILITGAGGFIGWHLTRYLKERGYWVRGVDIKEPEFEPTDADEFKLLDMRNYDAAVEAMRGGIEDVYALAADMGGAGFVFTGENDAAILRNNTLINLATIEAARNHTIERYLFTSSACVYPEYLQEETDVTPLAEEHAYPAQPDSHYGWEKLHAEHVCAAYRENYSVCLACRGGARMQIRIARFHNVYGTNGTWQGGREKVPAAFCRKVAVAKRLRQREVEVWGDGEQTRSFLYIDDCLDGLYALMNSNYSEPLNIGSDRMVSVNKLLSIVSNAANWDVVPKHIEGPQGVRGRNSDNTRCKEVLDWEPEISLEAGIAKTYEWIEQQVLASEVE